MDETKEHKPGRLKRKSKRSASASFMALPAVDSGEILREGALLGDELVDSKTDLPNSLLDFVIDSTHASGTFVTPPPPDEWSDAQAQPSHFASSSPGSRSLAQAEAPFQAAPVSERHTSSPLATLATRRRMPSKTGDASRDHIRASALADTLPSSATVPRLTSAHDSPLTDPQNPHGRFETALAQAESSARHALDALAQIQSIQVRSERRQFFNSAAAYALFCIVIAVGLYFAINYKASSKYHEIQYKNEIYQNTLHAKRILEDEFERNRLASSAAFEVYQLTEQGRFEEAIERFTAVRATLNHPAETALLESRIDGIRWRLADNAYHDGVILYNEQNLEQARDAFFKSLAYKENTAYTHMLHYYLAMSLFQLGDFEGARRYFEQAQAGNLSPDMDANTRFYRAAAAERVGDESEAFTQYDQFLRRYRNHRLADEASKRRARLERSRPRD